MIRLHIERLVVDGLPMDRAGAAQFQAALAEALGAMLAANPPSAGFSERVVRGGTVVAGGGLGEAVAAQIVAGLAPKVGP